MCNFTLQRLSLYGLCSESRFNHSGCLRWVYLKWTSKDDCPTPMSHRWKAEETGPNRPAHSCNLKLEIWTRAVLTGFIQAIQCRTTTMYWDRQSPAKFKPRSDAILDTSIDTNILWRECRVYCPTINTGIHYFFVAIPTWGKNTQKETTKN